MYTYGSGYASGGKLFNFCASPSPSLIYFIVHTQFTWLFHTDEQLFTQKAFYPVTVLDANEEKKLLSK